VGWALAMSGCQGKKPPVRPQPRVSYIGIGSPSDPQRLLRGFTAGNSFWRWTKRVFAVALDRPEVTDTATYLEMDFAVPLTMLGHADKATLTVRANGLEACQRTYDKDDRYLLACHIPEKALEKEPVEIEVEADRSYRDETSGEDRAIIVVSMALKEYEATAEYREAQIRRAREGFGKVAAQWKQMPPEKLRELTGLFHRLPAWQNMRHYGIPVHKNPLNLWMVQQIIYETNPDLIIETGTGEGGSALYYAGVLDAMGGAGKIMTVDSTAGHRAVESYPLWQDYVQCLQGSSTDPEIIKKITERAKGLRVLVTLGPEHSMAHVLGELKAYAPLVSKGSYLVVEGSRPGEAPAPPGAGPMSAVERFLQSGGNKDFEQDFSREMFLLTFNPGGWLRRK
jgi:cephalosporin hydroxylase